jgi:hypothetical protein
MDKIGYQERYISVGGFEQTATYIEKVQRWLNDLNLMC